MAVAFPWDRRPFPVSLGRGELPRVRVKGIGVEAGVLLGFSAAILATNYALAGFPNVKLFDLLVFAAGYALGFRRGAAVAALSWLVYGTLNPWGPTTAPLLATVAFSELVYAVAGSSFRRLLPPSQVRWVPDRHSLLLAAVAVACTVGYDALTNVYTGIVWAQLAGSTEYAKWLLIALFNPGALWFSAMHAGSNAAFFSLLGPALLRTSWKIRGVLPS